MGLSTIQEAIDKRLARWAPRSRRAMRWNFRRTHGYEPDLEAPRSLSEKLQWVKLNCDLRPLARYVDKFEVREFVRRRVGEDILVPLHGLYDDFDSVPVAGLPSSFAMKATHGCGWNLLVEDVAAMDWELARSRMKHWLSSDYARRTGEMNYAGLRGRILVEQLIRDPSGDLRDYKFYCCEGVPLGAHVDIDRFGDHRYRVYDADWREFEKTDPRDGEGVPEVPRPARLEDMLEICRVLSRGFPYVRVDLYYTGGKVYFGELTFTPASGYSPFDPVESDFYFGAPFDVMQYCDRPYVDPRRLK